MYNIFELDLSIRPESVVTNGFPMDSQLLPCDDAERSGLRGRRRAAIAVERAQ